MYPLIKHRRVIYTLNLMSSRRGTDNYFSRPTQEVDLHLVETKGQNELLRHLIYFIQL